MFRTCSLIFALIMVGCSTDALVEQNTLDSSLASKEVVLDNVIACAATSQGNDKINVFFYPRTGASNFQYFETESSDDDKNDFSNYVPVLHPLEDVFNGFLKKFEVTAEEEKWVIVPFDQEGCRGFQEAMSILFPWFPCCSSRACLSRLSSCIVSNVPFFR